MKGWDFSHIEKLKARGMVVVDHTSPLPKNRSIVIEKKLITKNISNEEPKPLTEIKQILKFMQVQFETEYKFLADRKFRFDIAIPDRKLAFEYEGLFANKSRHTTVTGYSNDTEKYNLAVINGWRVLRYTQLNYKRFITDFNNLS